MGLLDIFRTPSERPDANGKPRGASGRLHYNGLLQLEELNADLFGQAGLRIFDRMYRTDPDIRRNIGMICNPIVAGTWSVDPHGGDDATDKDLRAAEFARWALWDCMRPAFPNHLATALPVLLRSGFCPFEQIWKTDTYDGRSVLVPRKLDLRLPRSVWKWFQDDYGELESIVQTLPMSANTTIPAADLVYYRIGEEGDNWEGTSLLRAAYKPWLLKEAIEKVDAIAQERSGVGIPIAYPPQGADDQTRDEVEAVLANLRTAEQAYIVSPGPKADHAQPGEGWSFEILGFEGQSAGRDAQPSLKYHSEKIAAAFVADFMQLGHHEVGARATAQVQQDPFLSGVEAIAQAVADPINDLVAKMVALNFDVDAPPKVKMAVHDTASLAELQAFVSGLIASGAMQSDPELEDYLRERADLPTANPDIRAQRMSQKEAMAEAAQKAAETGGLLPANSPPANGDPAKPGAQDPPPAGPPAGPKKLARQARDLTWWEALMQLDRIEASLDGARAQFETAGGPAALDLARQTAARVADGKDGPTAPSQALVGALEQCLADLYDTGRQTVADELDAQRAEARPPVTLAAPPTPGQRKQLRKRATVAATTVLSQIRTATHRQNLNGRGGPAQLQRAAELAARSALRAEAQVQAGPVLADGRWDEARANADQIEGARYTSVMDSNSCDTCAMADDGELRALDDPILLELGPPNPECAGGGRCRCELFFQLADPGEFAPSG